ncbi:MAG: DUF4105 domain-containing protein, partial [Chitinophagales bacterium]
MKQIILFIAFCMTVFVSSAQVQLSESAEISVITCSPGDDLYNTFGHSAIRVQDAGWGIDVVYNYGTFSFGGSSMGEQLDFGLTFMRGQLLYWVSVSSFDNFVASYEYQERWVYEQVLNLSQAEKQSLFDELTENAKEENKYYRYDFFFDNCSSRIRDILVNSLGDVYGTEESIVHQSTDKSFIDLIDSYIVDNVWLDFGIDILLGSKSSAKATPYEYMFLPDYLMSETEKAEGLVKDSYYVIPFEIRQEKEQIASSFTPFIFFMVLMGLILFISIFNFKRNKHWFWLDRILLLITGVVGCLFLFMWLGTNHLAAHTNLNMLWAFPLNIIAVFFVGKKKFRPYCILILVLSVINLIGFSFLQDFHFAIIPILLLLIVRYAKMV